MIISFRHGFAFIAVPKTGSQAVRQCLRPVLADNDWEQCTLLDRRFFPVAALAEIGHGHIEWRQAAPLLLGRLEAMASFAVVRDPYDRFASFARFTQTGADDETARLKALLTDPAKRDHILLREQYRFVCDDAGAIQIGAVLRHERLAEELADWAVRQSLPLAPLQPVNVSPATSRFAYDAELRELVQHRYARDFALFGYDPDRAMS